MKTIMKEILGKYCIQENSGLLLLSMPTGFGKTHNVLDFIYENYQVFKEKSRKIIFITNLKKNLPYSDLEKRFTDHDRENEYQENVLFIDSNLDFVIKNLLDLDQEIPKQFKTESYQNLKKQLEKLAKSKNSDKDFQDWLKAEIKDKYEPAFRKSIESKLNEKSKKKQKRLDLIKNDRDYQWIGKLYPTVFTDEKTILFMSMDKFFLKNSTIIEPSYYCYQKLAKNALIFIDEFDATKDNILNQIINSGKKHKIDLINLFLNIHNHLKNTEFPEFLLQESEARQKYSGNKNWKSLREIIEEFKRDSQQIFNEYNLQYTYKSNQEDSKKSRNFLFYDYESHHVLDRHQHILIESNNDDKANWLKTVNNNNEDFKLYPRLSSLIARIGGFLSYFQRGVSFLAQNYQNLKKEQGNEIFSIEFAVSSVLDGFKIDRETITFLTSNIIENYNPFQSNQSKTDQTINQLQSFYEVGFKYHDIVDKDEHDLSSKIYFYNFNRTPESFLAKVCENAMVIGISATASMDSNIGNYDLDYLKNCLKDNFLNLSQSEIDQLKNDYNKLTQGYDQITIKPQFIGTESKDDALEMLEEMLDDEETANSLFNQCQGDSKDYNFCRYVKLLETWYYFNNNDCQAFICFLNKFPKSGDSSFNLDVIYKYFCYVNNLSATKENIKSIKNQVVILQSNNFDEDLKKLKERLGKGERIFIISTYQTLGAGVNLQYPIPEDFTPIKINDFDNRSQMDINGVYLEKPTNLIVSLNQNKIEDNDFIKHLFQLEFLYENYIMSRNQFKNKLDEAFHKYIGESFYCGKHEDRIDLYQTEAFTKFLNKVIIQALGRICRTNMKAPTIHILADHGIKKYLNRVPLPEDIIPVKEYDQLVAEAKQTMIVTDEIEEAQIKAENRSHKAFKYINRQLNSIWDAKGIKQWQSLREQVLIQPTIINKQDCPKQWDNIYLELPTPNYSYRFNQQDDFGKVEIFFSDDEGDYEVSENTSRLTQLMKIDLLKELFENSGYATNFEQSELMINPPIFNNIYKGALGEVCGKHILETQFKLKLLELDDHEYERFDFKTEDGIYFDFKFWSDTFDRDETQELEKVRAKMNEINAQKVFIINILAKEDRKFIPITSDNGTIIRVPFLCQNNNLSDQAIKYLLEELK